VYKVKIYGAGSIGNHLAHSCRAKGWDVLMCDLDRQALERTQQDIYPSRYGKWDTEIRLSTPENMADEDFDLVIIGTPPDSHMSLARSILQARPDPSYRRDLPERCLLKSRCVHLRWKGPRK
jgi:predicted dehydrogenase